MTRPSVVDLRVVHPTEELPVPSRSRPLLAASALVLMLVLSACGGGEGDAPPPPGAEGFPVTVPHAYGETTIEAPPQRVVTVGFNEADFALALGVVPVGEREVVGEFDAENRPWAQEALGGARPQPVGGIEIDIEQVAALAPDLVLGVASSMDEATYDALSDIAPTIAGPDPGGTPAVTWQEQTRITGQALGRTEEADRAIADVEERFNAARVDGAAFAGQTLRVTLGARDGFLRLGSDDPRTQLFTDLGFDVGSVSETLAGEQLSLLEAPGIALVGVTEPEALADPAFAALPAVREGRVAYLGDEASPFAGALGFSSPLSLPFAIDQAVPQLTRVYSG